MKKHGTCINQIKLTFPSLSENERFARLAVSGFLSQLNPQLDELSDVKTAVSEAVTNSIVHAYRDTVGRIDMEAKLFADETFYIRIKDYGCGIPDIAKAMEPLYTSAPEEERAGLGFAVMESFMDTVRVRSKVDAGTTVTMTKQMLKRKAVHG
ncbi:MAG: anti-sigma F factor [Oscillospiraceae bacterium]